MNNETIVAVGGLALMLWWLRQGEDEASVLLDAVRKHIEDLRQYTYFLHDSHAEESLQETHLYQIFSAIETYWWDDVLIIEADPMRITVNQVPEIVQKLTDIYGTYVENRQRYVKVRKIVRGGQERQDGVYHWTRDDTGEIDEIIAVFDEGMHLMGRWRNFVHSLQNQLAGEDSADKILAQFDAMVQL
jgi:hypothetical protein